MSFPDPPKITRDDLVPNDNLGEADMDLDEDMAKDNEPAQNWTNNWQPQLAIPQPELPVKSTPVVSQKAPHTQHQSRFSNEKVASRFIHRISSQPVVTQPQPVVTQAVESIDMVLDSDEDDGDGSPMMTEAQKRKKLPPWIREGLERIEREKKQSQERMQKEIDLRKDEENRKKMMEEALKELEREKTAKSKYVSFLECRLVGQIDKIGLIMQESPSEDEDEPGTRDGTPEKEQPTHAEVIQNDEDAYEKMVSSTGDSPILDSSCSLFLDAAGTQNPHRDPTRGD